MGICTYEEVLALFEEECNINITANSEGGMREIGEEEFEKEPEDSIGLAEKTQGDETPAFMPVPLPLYKRGPRNLFCPKCDDCLNFAIVKNWEFFFCDPQCFYFKEIIPPVELHRTIP